MIRSFVSDSKCITQCLLVGVSILPIMLAACKGIGFEDPDRIFNLVVPQIQKKAPNNWKVRLPTSIRITGSDGAAIKLYSQLEEPINSRFRISINSQIPCQARVCAVGSIFSEKGSGVFDDLKSAPILSKEDLDQLKKIQASGSNSKSQADTDLLMRSEGAILERSNVELGEGIQGTLILRNRMGASTPAAWMLTWEQDEQVYSVSFGTSQRPENRDEILDIGKSMVKARPIMRTQ
jgi:hypothetical protein